MHNWQSKRFRHSNRDSDIKHSDILWFHTRRRSAIRVPLPGPSSIIFTLCGCPICSHRHITQTPIIWFYINKTLKSLCHWQASWMLAKCKHNSTRIHASIDVRYWKFSGKTHLTKHLAYFRRGYKITFCSKHISIDVVASFRICQNFRHVLTYWDWPSTKLGIQQ